VQVLDPSGAPIAATRTPSNGNRTIAVTPLSLPLADQARFTIRVANVKDVIGKVMAAPFIGSFTTEDITAPQVSEITPGPDTTGAALSAPIRVRYNEPIDPARFTGPAIAMRVGATPVAGRIDVILGNTVVVFTPNLPLVEDTVYQVQVQAATDPAGNTQPQLPRTPSRRPTAPRRRSVARRGGRRGGKQGQCRQRRRRAVVDFINDQPALASRAVPFTLSFKALQSHGSLQLIKVTAARYPGNRGPFATTFVSREATRRLARSRPGPRGNLPQRRSTVRCAHDDVGGADCLSRGDGRSAPLPADAGRAPESFRWCRPTLRHGALGSTPVVEGPDRRGGTLTVSVLDGGPTVRSRRRPGVRVRAAVSWSCRGRARLASTSR
jgi:hypothetical protein